VVKISLVWYHLFMAKEQTVAKNTLFLTVGSICQKLLAFIYFTVLARHFLSPADVGRYLYALSYAALFSVIVDFGVQPVLIRAIAKDRSRARAIISNAIGIKTVFAIVTAAVMFWAAHITESDPVKIALISVACITLVLDSVQLTFYAVLRGYERLNYEAIGVLVGQSITVAAGGVMLYLKQPLPFLMFAYVCGSAWNAVYSWRMAKRVTGERFGLALNRDIWAKILRMALPFAAAAIFVRIYASADSVLLNRLAGNAAAAFYGVPYKFVFAFQFVPIALAAALFPTFSREAGQGKARLGELFWNAERYLMLIALPLVAGMVSLAHPLIVTFYKNQYLPSVPIMMILAWCLIPSFLDYPVGALLNASHKQNIQTSFMGIIMCMSIILNLLLIPHFGAIASAFAAVIGNSTLFIGGLFYAVKLADIPWKKLLSSFARIGGSAAAMAFVVIVTQGHLKLYFLVALGVAVYALGLFVTRELGRNDIMRFRDILRPPRPETTTTESEITV
jgi:O-antigen/teichoic acid export membrane protein